MPNGNGLLQNYLTLQFRIKVVKYTSISHHHILLFLFLSPFHFPLSFSFTKYQRSPPLSLRYNIMDPVYVPMTQPSASNGLSSTTNGDLSTHIPHQTHFQDQFHPQLGNPDNSQSISAGMCQYTPSIACDFRAPTFRVLDEIALYDRQIRLWGVRAQER